MKGIGCVAAAALSCGVSHAVGSAEEIYSILKSEALMFSSEDLGAIKPRDIEIMDKKEINELLRERDMYARYIAPGDLKKVVEATAGKEAGIGMDIFEDQFGNIRCAPYPGSPSEAAGIFYPDILTKVDGTPVKGLEIQNIADLIRGDADTDVVIEVNRDGKNVELMIPRTKQHYPDVMRIGDVPAVIKIFRFGNNTAALLEKEIRKVEDDYRKKNLPEDKRFFIDLRGNTGGVLEQAAASASCFLPAGATVYSYVDRRGDFEYKNPEAGRYQGRPFIIMQDRFTASSAEMFIVSLLSGSRGTVSTFGEQSYGKARVQKSFKLKNGGVLKISVGELMYSGFQGTWEGSGLKPDQEYTGNK